MKKIVLYIFLLTCLTNYSQQIEGKVTYKLSTSSNLFKKEFINKKNEKYGKMLNFINKSVKANTFIFTLSFNKNESFFNKNDIMHNDSNKSIQVASILVNADDIYYANKIDNISLIHKEAYGKLFLVKHKFNSFKWSLVNEKKQIGNYNCFKATTKKIIKNSKGVFNKEVISWYTPEIPASFGPKGYNGLPGMILELIEGQYIYTLDKIILNPKKKIKIKKPNKGTLITQDKLDEIGMKNFKVKNQT